METDNLKIQQQINAAIAERSKLLSSQTSLIADQVELATRFCKAMKCEGIDEISDRITEIRAGLESAGKAAAGSTAGVDELVDSLSTASDKSKEFSESAKMLGKQLTDAFSSGANSVKAFSSLVGSAAGGILGIGTSLLAIPLGVFDSMMNKAADIASGAGEIRQAMEAVRGQFGDISKGFSKQVVEGGGAIAKSLSKAGTSVGQVFGMGSGGTAAAIKASLELATALGPAVNLLGKGFAAAAGDLVVFQKGLGLTNEDMKAFIMSSKVMGTDVTKDLAQVAKISTDMADKFGMSSKDISRDMAYMTTQSGKFGKMTKTQMAAASVTVRSYGMELKDVAGILDQFSDFESAATNASKLAQAFGATIDPMKLMNEENPAEAFEYLRKQMLATGQDSATMNKAQIKLLATQTGMDENLVRTAFSAKNVGLSYEQVQKEAEKSGKKQKTQQEIFESLGKSIEKVVESLSHSGSFLDEFMTGLGEGISRTPEMRAVLGDLAKALQTVRKAGREVGAIFVQAFPGVKTMLSAMHDFFGGGSFKNSVKGFSESLKKFFEDLNKNPAQAFEKFYNNIKKKFFDMLDNSSPAGKKFLDGAKKFIMTLSAIMAGVIKMMGETLAKGLKSLVDFIKNPDEAVNAASGLGATFFAPIMKSLGDALPLVFDALVELLGTLLQKFAPKIALVFGAVFALGIAKALIMGVTQAAGAALITVAQNAMLKRFGQAVATAAAPPTPPGMGAGTGGALGGFIKGFSLISVADIVKAGLKMALIAVMLTVSAAAMVGGMILIGKMISAGGGMETFVDGLLSLGAAVLAVVGISFAATFINPGQILQASVGMLAATLFLLPLGLFVYALNEAVKMVGPINGNAIMAFAMSAAVGIGGIAIAFIAAALAGAALLTVGGWVAVGLALVGMGLMVTGLYAFGAFMKTLSSVVKDIGPIDTKSIINFSLATAVAMASIAIAFGGAIVAGALASTALVGALLLQSFGILAIKALGKFMEMYNQVSSGIEIDEDAIKTFSYAVASTMVSIAVAFGAATLAGALAPLAMVGAALLAVFGIATLGYISLFFIVYNGISKSMKIDPEAVTAFTGALTSVLVDVSIIFGYAAGAGLAARVGMVGAALLATTGIVALGYIGIFLKSLLLLLYVTNGLGLDETVSKNITTFSNSLSLIFAVLSVAFILASVAGLAAAASVVGVALLATFGIAALAGILVFSSAAIALTKDIKVSELAKASETIALIGVILLEVAKAMMIVAAAGTLLLGSAISGFFGGPSIENTLIKMGSFLGSIKTNFLDKVKDLPSATIPEGVGAAVKLVADLLGSLGPSIEAFTQVQKNSSGTFTTAAEDAATTEKMMASLGTFIEKMASSSTLVFGAIIAAAKSLTFDDTLQKKFDVVSKSVELSVNLISTMSSLIGGLPKIEGNEIDSAASVSRAFVSAINGMKDSMFGENGMLQSIAAEIPNIFNTIKTIADQLPKDTRGITRKIDVISKVIEAFGTMAGTMSSMKDLIPTKTIKAAGGDKGGDQVVQVIGALAPLLNSIIAAFGPQLSALVTEFNKIEIPGDVRSMKEKAKKIGIVMNAFGDLVKLVTSIPREDITPPPKEGGDAAVAKETMASALARLETNIGLVLGSMTRIGDIKEIKDGSVVTTADSIAKAMKSLPATMKIIENSLAGYGLVMEKAGGLTAVGAIGNVTKMVEDMKELDTLLASIDIGPIDGVITKLGKNMEISKEQISINHKPINISLTMNVSFDAKSFTKDVFKVAGQLTKNHNGDLADFGRQLSTGDGIYKEGR